MEWLSRLTTKTSASVAARANIEAFAQEALSNEFEFSMLMSAGEMRGGNMRVNDAKWFAKTRERDGDQLGLFVDYFMKPAMHIWPATTKSIIRKMTAKGLNLNDLLTEFLRVSRVHRMRLEEFEFRESGSRIDGRFIEQGVRLFEEFSKGYSILQALEEWAGR